MLVVVFPVEWAGGGVIVVVVVVVVVQRELLGSGLVARLGGERVVGGGGGVAHARSLSRVVKVQAALVRLTSRARLTKQKELE